ncbi:MAG TPA: GNAT family N-acetyltransferase [Stellaceae bacterium]|nr:GNAT family N-acetyltransferase [Stellaceae bacterium]
MKDATLVLTDAPSADACTTVDLGLGGYNAEQAGYWDARPLAVLAQDPVSGRILGGLIGRTSLGLLFVDLAFLPAELRGHELGTRMLRMAEEEGVRRGCRRGVLYTISFQAPGFYERHGWREFGRVPCEPKGTARVFMTKELA